MINRLARLLVTLAALFAGPAIAAAQGGITRYVNASDASCGGHLPCYLTIQAAVNAALPGETIQVQAGTYHEQVSIAGKNNTASASEADRIVIQADPAAAVGSVILQGAVTQCASGYAVQFQQSKFVTVRGLTITGAGGQAVSLLGGSNQNQAIHLERLRIFGNGSSECNGGVTIAGGNPGTLIVNSLIYGNGRNGIATLDIAGGPHYIIGNTIHANAWSGVNVTRNHETYLVNNAITGNGTAAGTTGGRSGVVRESTTTPNPAGIHLLNNLICGNRLGEISGPALDASDGGNLTPGGAEGLGVSASPGCQNPTTVYANVNGADGLANTADDDFKLASGSPAIDHGRDPRTLGLATSFNPLFEADYLGDGARPRPGTATGPALFDMGAREFVIPDTQAPAVSFTQPQANAFVRQTITVQAQATDNVAIATFGLTLDNQALTATVDPTLPAPSATATATLVTTTLPDGTHTLAAAATDRAGNPGNASIVVKVDNTPPTAKIESGPSGQTNDTTVTFTFSGSDNLTPIGSLQFASRLDGAAFSAFSLATSATFPNLTEGQHTFEVKAVDLAGNESATASRTFTVVFGPSIALIGPTSGTIGTFVTLTGDRLLDSGTTTVAFNGVAAVVRSITNTTITTTVPIGATTGDVTVTTVKGTGRRAFTVTTTGDFNLNAAPATVRAVAGDQGAVNIAASGSGSFTSLVSLNVSGAPAGVTPKFNSTLVAPGGGTFLTLAVAATVAPGSYVFTVSGDASVDGRTLTRTATFALQVLAADTPALTGRVLTADSIPQPIPGVTVTLGSAFTLTDGGGNFVLLAPPAGPNMLLVDGRTASPPGAQYPPVEVNVAPNSSGPTRVPFPVYLPKLDTANPITLPIDPTDQTGTVITTTQATTPTIPGLVVTIPAGTRIIGSDGVPVRQITITPVPIDRSPMPFPPGVTAPMLFTIQPGGAVPSQPLPITFPNPEHSPPGTKADLYFFDLATGNWAVWGTGTVSADGTQIVSDPGFGLPRFAWHYPFCGTGGGGPPPGPGGGDPVDLFTGRFTVSKTDLMIPGRLPIMIQRAYNATPASTQPGMFGRGWTLGPYDAILTTSATSLELIQPDQTTMIFTPTGTGQWTNTGRPEVTGAVITQVAGEFSFELRFKDGTRHRFDRIVGFANAAGLSAIIDRNGNTVTVERTTIFPPGLPPVFGRIVRITDPAGRALTLSYDTQARLAQVTDPIGRTVQYRYDAQSRLSTVTDPGGGVTTYTYDTAHRITSITDARGITYLTNDYDSNGRVSRQTLADGGVWRFDYTLNGRLVTQTVVTDPRGNPTTHRFTAQGLEISRTDALGQTTTYERDQTTNLVRSVMDPLKRVTRYDYDAAGNRTKITDAAGNMRTFTYEPVFNKVSSITAVPILTVTGFEYDAAGNLTAIVDPLGARTTLTYNGFGQLTSITDPLGNTTTFTYDATGNLVSIVDPLGNVTTRQYDTVSRLIGQSNPLVHTTRYAYDALNRTTTITDALGGIATFGYDPNGNLLTVTDARNNTTQHVYDAMDRLAFRTDPVGAVETFSYDVGGNVTRHVDRKGQVATFTYDPLNRRTSGLYADGSSTSFVYDTAGRLVTAIDSVGGTIENTFDVLDRLTSQSTTLGTVGYQYDALGRRTTMTAAGQAPVSYDYDAASQLRAIQQTPLSPATFDYDPTGRRTRLTLPNGVSTDYQYDAASRLTALTYRNAVGPLGDLTYTYDRAGNRTRVGGSFARTLLPDPIDSASYDAANRQLTFGARNLTYDANGNLTSDGTNSYTWDARNRLIALTGPTSGSYVYDGIGRRSANTLNGVRTDFLYDGLDIALELTGRAVTPHLRSLRIDEPLLRGTNEFYLAGALGTAIALADATGSPTTVYTYEPFGGSAASGTASTASFRFTGRESDGGTGLYYYRARYYHPGLHRFVSADPIGFRGGVNFYAYVGDNPLRYIDPLGLDKQAPDDWPPIIPAGDVIPLPPNPGPKPWHYWPEPKMPWEPPADVLDIRPPPPPPPSVLPWWHALPGLIVPDWTLIQRYLDSLKGPGEVQS